MSQSVALLILKESHSFVLPRIALSAWLHLIGQLNLDDQSHRD
jgi:hypothetical protein